MIGIFLHDDGLHGKQSESEQARSTEASIASWVAAGPPLDRLPAQASAPLLASECGGGGGGLWGLNLNKGERDPGRGRPPPEGPPPSAPTPAKPSPGRGRGRMGVIFAASGMSHGKWRGRATDSRQWDGGDRDYNLPSPPPLQRGLLHWRRAVPPPPSSARGYVQSGPRQPGPGALRGQPGGGGRALQ